MQHLSQFMWVLITLLSHYRRHPGQALFMASGLITGVALWSAVQLINEHARVSYAEADQLLGAEARYWIRAESGEGIDPDEYIRLRRLGFRQIYPVIETRRRTVNGSFVSIIATDLLALPADNPGASTSGPNPLIGDDWLLLIQPEYRVWYPASLATQLGVNPGDLLPLVGDIQLPPAVIQTRDQQGQRVFMDIGAAMAVLGEAQFSYLAVGALGETNRARLKASLPRGLLLIANQQAIDMQQLTASLHTNLSAMGLLSFAVGLFIVFNAVRFSLLARQHTLTTLREMGTSVTTLITAITVESLLWSILGTSVGILGGHWLSHQLLPAVAISMQSLFGASLGGNITLELFQVIQAFLLTVAGVVLALAVPLWQKIREPILQARAVSAQWQRDARAVRYMAGMATLLFVSAALLYPGIASVTDGFVVLALVMFAGAFLLPLLIQLVTGLVAHLAGRHWQLRWAISDVRAQMPHLRIALMALLLTLTANIGVTTLVDSFRTALANWLDNRLSASIYVQSDSLDVASLQTGDWLLAKHERLSTSQRWQDRPVSIRGLNIHAPDARDMKLSLASEHALTRWQSGEGSPIPILANEQVHFLSGTPTDAIIQLATPGGIRDFQVVGFFHDYGNANYQFYLPDNLVRTFWPRAKPQGVALWIAPGQYGAAADALIAAGTEPGDWVRQDDIRRISFAIFDRTFAITGALNMLTLLVAGVALLAALMAVHQQRLPEYAHWRSLGVTFNEWLQVVAVPLMLMVLITGLLSLPLGLALSWLLIHKLNVMAFGWTMPLLWSWEPVLRLALITLGIVAVAQFIAVIRVGQELPGALKQLAGNDG